MKTRYRLLLCLLAAPLLIAVLCVAVALVDAYSDRRAGAAFARVEMGAPESTVVALLGEPDLERPCGENLWWGGDGDYRGRNDGRCVTEARYEYFLSAWGIGYSADRRVVSKYHYVSE